MFFTSVCLHRLCFYINSLSPTDSIFSIFFSSISCQKVLSIEMMWEASWLLVELSCKMAKTLVYPRSFVVKVVFLHCLIEQSCLCRAKRQGHVLRLVHLLHSLPTGATIAWDCKPAIAVDNCTFWAEQTFPSIIWQQRPTRKKSLVPIFYSFPFLLCSDHLLTKQVFSFVILH